MIEDDVRTLLAERAGNLPANAARAVQVRSRVRRIRRRRTAAAALGLVVVAAAGSGLARRPGPTGSLTAAAPPGSWFADGSADPPGWVPLSMPVPFTGTVEDTVVPWPEAGPPLPHRILVDCQRRGTLTVSNLSGGPRYGVRCDTRVGHRYQGALSLDADQARVLFAGRSDRPNIRYEPSSGGQWRAAAVQAVVGAVLPAWRAAYPPAADGTVTPAGTTVAVTLPRRTRAVPWSLGIAVDCTTGIVLRISVPGGTLADVDCDPTRGNPQVTDYHLGRMVWVVSGTDLDRVGLRSGQTVPLTVRSVGADTGRWRIALVQ